MSLHRARARWSMRLREADFIHRNAADEIEERLRDVNRTFTAPAIVTAHPEIWADAVPGAVCVPPGEVLDLRPGAHDLVVHAMALHWADDPVGQIVQCRRALVTGRAVPCGGFRWRDAERASYRAGGGRDRRDGRAQPPRVAPMAEVRQMGALLQRAGLALPVADALRMTAKLWRHLRPDARSACDGRNQCPGRPSQDAGAAAACSRALPRSIRTVFADDEGRIRATFEVIFLTGWAPHESQQKPLRPGSAQTRLAEALNATHVQDNPVTALDRADD